MTHSREEILEMQSAKRISTEEAEKLLGAIEAGRPGLWTWLLNPLARMSSPLALALTLVPLAVQLFLETQAVAFDGALDIHTSGHPIAWPPAFLHLLVGFPLLATVFWAIAASMKRGARAVDLAAAAGLSRWPLTAAGFLALPLAGSSGGTAVPHLDPLQLVPVLCTLPLLAWSVTMLCLGFRTASGLRGKALSWSFVCGLLIAEAISKLILRLA